MSSRTDTSEGIVLLCSMEVFSRATGLRVFDDMYEYVALKFERSYERRESVCSVRLCFFP